MTQIDRRALFASGAAAALLAATGLAAAPQRGGVLRAALSGARRTDGWDACAGHFMQAAHATMFEGLAEIAADGTLRGEIAQSWSSDDTATSWRFELRETLFHDGLPLRADDLAWSLAGIGQIDATARDVTITLSSPNPNLPYHLAAPEFLIRPADGDRRAQGIGSGLYRLRKFDPGRHVIADRVPDHWKMDLAGWFDTIDLVHFADDAVRAQALIEGLVDVADIATLTDEAPDGFLRLPDASHTTQIVGPGIALPAQTGRAFALDNFRMAERWWRA